MNRRSRRRRQWLALAGVGVLAAVAGGGWAWSRRQVADAASGGTPDLWQSSFPGPGGRTVTMAALRGKPLVVNFWATWCAPCIKELPQFDRFQREFGPRGWQVVGLAIDSDQAVASFLQHTPVSFPIGLAAMDGTELMLALGNGHGVLPFTVVFGADGKVRDTRVGETHYEDLVAWAGKA